jgi:beta-glucosidase-like glycosyl hydrolase
MYEWGAAMATEFKGKGANVQLAPVRLNHTTIFT